MSCSWVTVSITICTPAAPKLSMTASTCGPVSAHSASTSSTEQSRRASTWAAGPWLGGNAVELSGEESAGHAGQVSTTRRARATRAWPARSSRAARRSASPTSSAIRSLVPAYSAAVSMRGHAIQLPIRRSVSSRAAVAGVAPGAVAAAVGVVAARVRRAGPALPGARGRAWRRRLLLGWLAGLGFFGIGWFWFIEFTLPGGVLSILVEALFLGAACRARAAAPVAAASSLPRRPPRCSSGPGAVAVRGRAAWRACPRPGRRAARRRSPASAGRCCSRAGRRSSASALAEPAARAAHRSGRVAVVLVRRSASSRPTGEPTASASTSPSCRAAAGGASGPSRPTRPTCTTPTSRPPTGVRARRRPDALARGRDRRRGRHRPTPEVADDLAALARRHTPRWSPAWSRARAPTTSATRRWRGAPTAGIVGRYEKVRRVPFGEYIPFRSLVDEGRRPQRRPAPTPSTGDGPNVLDTPAGRLGVAISYEVFFADRGRGRRRGRRAAARAHQRRLVLHQPGARPRSWPRPGCGPSAGRTGAARPGRPATRRSSTPDGRVRARTALGRRQVIHAPARAPRTAAPCTPRWATSRALAAAAVAGLLTAPVKRCRESVDSLVRSR